MMLNSRSRPESRRTRTRGSGRALKPQRRKAKRGLQSRRARYDTTVQAVRVRRVGGTRGRDLWRDRDAGPADYARAKSRTRPVGEEWVRDRGEARRDPRVPRFQGWSERHSYRSGSHARPVALPWAGLIPLNGKTLFNVAVLALLGWALMWFFTSERFYVRRVEAVGNSQVSAQVLKQVSGLEGYSVFWINPKRVSEQILDTLPPIMSVQVRYGLFDQNGLAAWVKLIVQERGQEIVWQVAGQQYWVDEGGDLHEVRGPMVGDPSQAAEPESGSASARPRLLIRDLRPSLPAQVDLAALNGARQLIHLLPEVRAMEYAPGTGLRLRHPRGWMVYLGTGEDMPKKVGVLRAMEVEFAAEGVVQPTLVDLRFPDSPYFRLPDANSPAGEN
jgi:hypothetical protein